MMMKQAETHQQEEDDDGKIDPAGSSTYLRKTKQEALEESRGRRTAGTFSSQLAAISIVIMANATSGGGGSSSSSRAAAKKKRGREEEEATTRRLPELKVSAAGAAAAPLQPSGAGTRAAGAARRGGGGRGRGSAPNATSKKAGSDPQPQPQPSRLAHQQRESVDDDDEEEGPTEPSAASTAASTTEDRIWRLSECCEVHRRLSHAGRAEVLVECHEDEGDGDSGGGNGSSHDGALPAECRTAFASLRLILPQLEADLTPPLVPAMCDFYRAAMSGIFCPHAPHLFRLGRGGREVFPRVHLLFRHLISRKVVSGCAKAAPPSLPREGTRSGPDPPSASSFSTIMDDIVETASLLLAFVPEPVLHGTVADDLVALLLDAGDLNRLALCQEASIASDPGEDGPPLTSVRAELELWGESLRAQQQLLPSSARTPTAGLLRLEACAGPETLALELASIRILSRFSRLSQRSEMRPPDDRAAVPRGPDEALLHGQWDRWRRVGVRFGSGDGDVDEELVLGLADVLIRPLPVRSLGDRDARRAAAAEAHALSSHDRKQWVLALQGKVSACDLLQAVLRDAGPASSASPLQPWRVQLARAVSRACGLCLDELVAASSVAAAGTPEAAHGESLNDEATLVERWLERYRSRLASLLLKVVPIRAERQMSEDRGSFSRVLHTVVRPNLLEAVSRIVPCRGPVTPERCRDVEVAVLRALHAALLAVDDPSTASVLPAAASHRLVQLLEDPSLSAPAVFVLAHCCGRRPGFLDPDLEELELDNNLPAGDTAARKRTGRSGGVEENSSAKRHKSNVPESGTPPSDSARVKSPPVNGTAPPHSGCWHDRVADFVARARTAAIALQVDLIVPPKAESDLMPTVTLLVAAVQLMVLCDQSVPPCIASAIKSLVKHVAPRPTPSLFTRHALDCAAFISVMARSRSEMAEELRRLVHSTKLSDMSFHDVHVELSPALMAHLCIDAGTNPLEVSKGIFVLVSRASSIHPVLSRADLFAPVTTDAGEQHARLATLHRLTPQPAKRAAVLTTATVQCLHSIPRDHCNAFVRLLRWQSLLWLATSSDQDLLRQNLPYAVGREEVRWFLMTSVGDKCRMVRDYGSQHVGVLFRPGRGYSALAADEVEWQAQTRQARQSGTLSASQGLASRVFQDVDRILHEFCSVPQCCLSFTVGSLSSVIRCGDQTTGTLKDVDLCYRRSAFRLLASIGSAIKISDVMDRILFEESLKRIVCLLSATDALQRFDSIGLGFGELSIMSRIIDLEERLRDECVVSLAPALFRDIFFLGSTLAGNGVDGENCLSAMPQAQRESQYLLLAHLIQRFCTEPCRRYVGLVHDCNSNDVLRFLELCLPHVISQFIVEKDYDSMLLTTGFKLYLQSQNRMLDRQRKRTGLPDQRLEILVDEMQRGLRASRGQKSRVRSWTVDLETQTRLLCLAPVFIEQILPAIFMKAGRMELMFFVRTVLQKKISLQTILTQREQLILRGLVWEAGKSPETTEAGIRAIRAAAIARSSSDVSCNDGQSHVHKSESNADQDTFAAASDWVSSHFMYLLVNITQNQWSIRPDGERLRALRCLEIMMQLLKAADSPAYFPQVMATVNAAIRQDSCVNKIELRSLAVKAFKQYLQLVAGWQWETLGQNLMEIVVSLIPLLPDDDRIGQGPLEEPTKLAISVLEWLTEGTLGTHLAPFFAEVPFLPSSSYLNSVRSALRNNGVDVDSLQVATTQGTQLDISLRGSLTSDGLSTSSDSLSVRRQVALQARLGLMCSLLSNENSSVRCVALNHISALLRGNRELFSELVFSESVASATRFLTVANRRKGRYRGTVTDVVEALLARSIVEMEHDARIRLAECLGEVGAIDMNLLHDDVTVAPMRSESVDNSVSWRRMNPPWRSIRARYELQLVTNHLVQGLKAAPSSGDQHKIGFCIQQLLVHLDNSIRKPSASGHPSFNSGDRDPMSDWLKSQLIEAGVMDIVEPFWHSEFHEAEGVNATKQPPFFQKSPTYFSWISSFCRHMIYRSHESKSPWGLLFFACRTAVRTTAGLSTSEFLLPILVLDRLCFGNSQDEHVVISEIRDALATTQSESYSMDLSELQKAVNVVFTVIDTLQLWAEEETEKRHHLSRRSASSSHSVNSVNAQPTGNSWPLDDTIMRIEDMLQAIPLSLRAEAAAKIGMNARALRLLEMAARESVVDVVFNGAEQSNNDLEGKWRKSRAAGSFTAMETDRVNDLLAALQDYETMGALESNTSDPLSSAKDCIRLKVAGGDWAGALPDYERALQLNSSGPRDMLLQRGSLRCLLELGQYESVLNQVHGIVDQNRTASSSANAPNEPAADLLVPLGIEAAWRLGRWDTLSELVSMGNGTRAEPEARFQQSVGKMMLGIHKREHHAADLELKKARDSLMVLLSSSARESYSRAYEHVVKLQSLREIEDASLLLCKESQVDLREVTSGLCWKNRLDFVSESGMKEVVKSRLALSRLAQDRVMEGSLFFHLGKRARKSRSYNIAATCFAQAEAVFISPHADRLACSDMMNALKLQVAKLKHVCGESSAALKMLSAYDNLENAAGYDQEKLIAEVSRRTSLIGHSCVTRTVDDKAISIFVRSALQSTLWMIEGGLRSSAQIVSRFNAIHKIAPGWERGHFQYAKYIDGLSESRMKALVRRLPQSSIAAGLSDRALRGRVFDKVCQKHVLLAMKHYGEALKLGMKHVYQSLPRLLSLWFDSLSVRGPENPPDLSSVSESGRTSSDEIARFRVEANTFMAQNFKQIPAIAFYTAIPQLLSRVIHDDQDTAMVVRGILRRVLVKFPQHAVWQLGWIRMSHVGDRREIGAGIFAEAEKALLDSAAKKGIKKENARRLTINHSLLVSSRSLFQHLQKLAKHIPQDGVEKITVTPWKGEVELSEFIPPVQAALSPSLAISNRGSEPFPRQIPRMTAFCRDVGVMHSRAKPKRLKAIAIGPTGGEGSACEIGEYHFLVKNEPKGDLRKDARVQDLNNVINRMMSVSSGQSLGHRRLHLRTFMVTVLSEDTGMLEWVPMTKTVRELVTKSYNPQASPFSPRRRGRRATHFVDNVLKGAFDKAHKMFLATADAKRAAAMFEELCLKAYPPLLYWWFLNHFVDPHSWYEARTRFALSCAVWSGVGHVIGLGDRHAENILVDTASGACVHVDFDCLFDKGVTLPVAEVVPFRLTQNMLDAFGPTGADGLFVASLHRAMTTLRHNRDTLLSVLEPFVNDPIIDWKRFRSQQKHNAEDRQTKEAKRSILVIDERLQGIYNLVNPNWKKLEKELNMAIVDKSGDDDLQHLVPLSVEGQVHKMISEATSNENLVQQYVGWMPWV